MNKLNINPQGIPSPNSDISSFYLDKDDFWKGFNRVSEYTYDEGREGKPCIDFTCGNKSFIMPYQQVLLLLETLKADPDFLTGFMEWVHPVGIDEIQPQAPQRKRPIRRTPIRRSVVVQKPSNEELAKLVNIEFDTDESFKI